MALRSIKFQYLKILKFFLLTTAFILSSVWIITQFYNYLLVLGGDPLIHLIFAKNFSSGYFFHFNTGNVSSAATSPIYVIFLSIFYLLFGDYFILSPKIISLLSLLLIILLIYKKFNNKLAKINNFLLILFFCVFPPIIFQALYGMENMLFSLLGIYIILNNEKILNNKLYLLIIPFLIFLRPESIFLILGIFSYLVFKKKFIYIFYILLGLLICLIIIGSLDFFYGFNNFAAGNSRRILNDLVPDFLKYIDLKYLKIYTKPLVAIIYLLPFIVLLATYRKKISFFYFNFTLFIFFLPLIAHIIGILPNSHFPRYFLFPYIFCIVMIGIILINSKLGKFTQTFILSILIIFFSSINLYRSSLIHNNNDLYDIFENIKESNIANNSNQIISYAGTEITNIALTEIQHKLYFNDKFNFYSLDGLINSDILKYNQNKIINLEKFIINNNINILIPFPSKLGKRFLQMETYPSNDFLYNLDFNNKKKFGKLFYEKKLFKNKFNIPFIILITEY